MLDYTFWKKVEFNNDETAFKNMTAKKHFSAAVVLNLVDENNHACDTGCSFCKWRDVNFNEYCCPSKELLLEFTEQFCLPNGYVELTGGGDPLYKFEQNKEKIKELVDTIITSGRTAKIVTTKTDIVKQYYKSQYLQDVSYFSFSVPYLNEEIKQLILELLAAGKRVAISTILNYSDTFTQNDLSRLIEYCKFYNIKSDNFHIIIRPNYNYPQFNLIAARQQVMEAVKKEAIEVNFKITNFIIHMYQLIGHNVLYCSNTDDFLNYFKEQKNDIK